MTLLTEQEAKQKWCPQARVVPAIMRDGHMVRSADVPAHNRVQEQGIPDDEQPTTHAAMNCMGPACMAWRWETRVTPVQHLEIDPVEKTGRGWCGIAGKPEA